MAGGVWKNAMFRCIFCVYTFSHPLCISAFECWVNFCTTFISIHLSSLVVHTSNKVKEMKSTGWENKCTNVGSISIQFIEFVDNKLDTSGRAVSGKVYSFLHTNAGNWSCDNTSKPSEPCVGQWNAEQHKYPCCYGVKIVSNSMLNVVTTVLFLSSSSPTCYIFLPSHRLVFHFSLGYQMDILL